MRMQDEQAREITPLEERSDDQAIRGQIANILAAVVAKDAKRAASVYAEEGMFLPTGMPQANGRAEIEATWKSLFDLPGFSLWFGPTRVDVSRSGDMASDVGTYELQFDGENGHVTDRGKYLVVWRKVDGRWQIFADCFNSNGA